MKMGTFISRKVKHWVNGRDITMVNYPCGIDFFFNLIVSHCHSLSLLFREHDPQGVGRRRG